MKNSKYMLATLYLIAFIASGDGPSEPEGPQYDSTVTAEWALAMPRGGFLPAAFMSASGSVDWRRTAI